MHTISDLDGLFDSKWRSFIVSPRWLPQTKAIIITPIVAEHHSNFKIQAFWRNIMNRVNTKWTT